MNLEISLHPLDPLSSPCRRTERIREVLRLASNLAIAELHDADDVRWLFIIGQHVLGDPECSGAYNTPDDKALLVGLKEAAPLNILSAADSFA